jgi:hypothetical protein
MFTKKQLELIRAMIGVVQCPENNDEETIDFTLDQFDNIDPTGSRVEELKAVVDEMLKEVK